MLCQKNKNGFPSLEKAIEKVNACELRLSVNPEGHLLKYFIVQQENYFIIQTTKQFYFIVSLFLQYP
jgi:hypothetical protein